MISKLSKRVTQYMLTKGFIKDDEKDIYFYGYFMMISQVVLFIITCILGVILNCLFKAIIFYIVFQAIRKYAGGYHATTETRCEFISGFSMLFCLWCIKLLEENNTQLLILTITAIADVSIFSLCPLDTPEKPLTEKEKKYFRKKSRIILFVINLIIGIGWYFKINILIYPCCMSLILECLLLFLAKIKEKQ